MGGARHWDAHPPHRCLLGERQPASHNPTVLRVEVGGQETGRGTAGYTCNQMADYMLDAQIMRQKYGVKTIFLATGKQAQQIRFFSMLLLWQIINT